MHYVADDSKIASAKEDVDAAKRQLDIDAIEKEIDLLNEQKDLLNEQIDLLDEQTDNINKYYDAQIKSLEKQKESTEKYFEMLTKSLEGSKDKYQELLDIVDKAELSGKLKKLGIDEEALLNGSEEEFEKLKNAYLDVVFQVNEGNEEMLSSLRELSGYDGTAPVVLTDTTEKLDEMNTQLDDSTESMDKLSDSAASVSTSTEGLSENLTSINDALTDIPEADKLDHLTTSFANLGEAIQAVADVLGIGEEGAVSTLVSALQEISTLSLDGSGGEGGSGSGIISQFQTLKTAVDDVTNAISGGGSSGGQEGDASTSSSPSMSSGAGGEDANGLVGAIGDIKSATDESLGGGEGEDSGAIPQFQELRTAVDDVTAAIGIGESENGEVSENTLIGALRAQYETASEVLPEEKTLFDELLESIMSCVSALNSMVSMISSIPEVGGFSGISVTPHAKGTVGNAFAKGTGKYKGLPKAEKNALVSEYGQTEMTVLPNGKTIITDEPTMMNLPKDTVIFNEEQTKKIMNNKVDASGNAYKNGTGNLPVNAPPEPMPLEMPLWERMEKCAAALGRTMEEMLNPLNSLALDIKKETGMGRLLESINNVSNVTNNNKNIQQPVINGGINITCPGVTSKEVAQQVGVEVDRIFNGMHLEAEQRSRMR